MKCTAVVLGSGVQVEFNSCLLAYEFVFVINKKVVVTFLTRSQ